MRRTFKKYETIGNGTEVTRQSAPRRLRGRVGICMPGMRLMSLLCAPAPTPVKQGKRRNCSCRFGRQRSTATLFSWAIVTTIPHGGISMTKANPKLISRIARIEGQVRGIGRMVGEERYCIDILTQIQAVKAALKSVEQEI